MNAVLEKQQGVKAVQRWINLSGLIAVLLNHVVKQNHNIIVESVIILYVLYSIPLPMTWTKAIMEQESSNVKNGANTMASSKEYLSYILEQLSGLDEITYNPMMGKAAGRNGGDQEQASEAFL